MKIKILHIIHGKHYGGGENIAYLLNRYINKQEFNVETVCLASGYFENRLRNNYMKACSLNIKSKVNPLSFLRFILLVKKNKPNLIHAHSFYTSIMARFCSFFLKIPNICTIQAPFVRDTNSLKQKKINLFLDRISNKLVNKYISVNFKIASELIRSSLLAEKIIVIYNGIEVTKRIEALKNNAYESLGILKLEMTVAMVAGFRPRKGPEYLLRAIPKILAQIPDVKFVFVGNSGWVEDKDYLQELKDIAKNLSIHNKIIFTGFREDVLEIMKMMDIIVLPSIFGEGTPLVLLEAMALSKPVVATDTEGNNEVVLDRETGILVPPRDSESLAKAIIELLKNSQLRTKMGQAGFERAKKKFNVEQMVKSYEETYRQVIQEHKKEA